MLITEQFKCQYEFKILLHWLASIYFMPAWHSSQIHFAARVIWRMVNDERNNALADQYRTLAAKEENVIFGGRLAEYKYYDMAPIIEMVHSLTF